jgi:hypothetical protein
MPRSPIDYSKTIIYKLVHKEDYDNANIYIGSTINFIVRKNKHKYCCNNETNPFYNQVKYQYIRNNGGWDCFNMIEVEKYPCNDKREVEAREQYWISYFNTNLNMKKSYRTDDELKEYNTKYFKERYEENKEIILTKQREKLICECGCIIARGNMRDHKKSLKHLNFTHNIN